MDAARREKKEHGTLAFPFQIYPALDGSEADDSDFIPYHWHPEFEIITVDAGHVSLTIADHVYEGVHGDVFFVAGEELHVESAPRDGKTSSVRSCSRRTFCSLRAATRRRPSCSRRWPRGGCGSRPACAPASRGRARCARCWRRSCAPVWRRHRAASSRSRRRCWGSSRSARRTACCTGGRCARTRITGRVSSGRSWAIWRAFHRAAAAAGGGGAVRAVAAVFQQLFSRKLRPHLCAACQFAAYRAGGAPAARDRPAGDGGRLQRRV